MTNISAKISEMRWCVPITVTPLKALITVLNIWNVFLEICCLANNGICATAICISTQAENGRISRILLLQQVPRKYPTSTPQVEDKLHTDNQNIINLIKIIAAKEMSVKEMMSAIGLKDRKSFGVIYLEPSLTNGFVRMLYPNSPRHPRQKYLLTAKGQAMYQKLFNQ